MAQPRCSCIWDVTEIPFHRILIDPFCTARVHPGDDPDTLASDAYHAPEAPT